jgi:hypothetical protein
MARACMICGKELTEKARKKFCSRTCRRVDEKRRYRGVNPVSGIPSATVGAMHELIAGIDLLKRGFHVFRSLTPSAPGDLMIMNGDKKTLMVEVTTGTRAVSGKLMYPSHKKYEHLFDVIAVVEKDGNITYIPELPGAKS